MLFKFFQYFFYTLSGTNPSGFSRKLKSFGPIFQQLFYSKECTDISVTDYNQRLR